GDQSGAPGQATAALWAEIDLAVAADSEVHPAACSDRAEQRVGTANVDVDIVRQPDPVDDVGGRSDHTAACGVPGCPGTIGDSVRRALDPAARTPAQAGRVTFGKRITVGVLVRLFSTPRHRITT